MTQSEEVDQLRAERAAWREIAHEKQREMHQLQQGKQVLREGLGEAIQATLHLQEHTHDLEEQIGVLQERLKMLERQQAKDSHNSLLIVVLLQSRLSRKEAWLCLRVSG